MTGVIWIAAVLAVIAIGVVFVILPNVRQPSKSMISSGRSVVVQSQGITSPVWDAGHLGANGEEKCRAFRQVVKHTQELQVAGGGTISPVHSERLRAELKTAKAMAPTALTPSECGVPL